MRQHILRSLREYGEKHLVEELKELDRWDLRAAKTHADYWSSDYWGEQDPNTKEIFL